MRNAPDCRLYLFAPLPDAIGRELAISNDVEPMLPGLRLVSAQRRHITMLDLNPPGVPQAYLAALVGWVMATMPPCAFRVIFDRIVAGGRSTLLKASEPIAGAIAAQAQLLDAMRHYGLDLPARAAPTPHVTLGYGDPARAGTRAVDGISWLVEELVLVRSWRGRSWHEELGRWSLPVRARVAA